MNWNLRETGLTLDPILFGFNFEREKTTTDAGLYLPWISFNKLKPNRNQVDAGSDLIFKKTGSRLTPDPIWFGIKLDKFKLNKNQILSWSNLVQNWFNETGFSSGLNLVQNNLKWNETQQKPEITLDWIRLGICLMDLNQIYNGSGNHSGWE